MNIISEGFVIYCRIIIFRSIQSIREGLGEEARRRWFEIIEKFEKCIGIRDKKGWDEEQGEAVV